MLEPQASRFWNAALKSGLVDPGLLTACWEQIPPEKRTPDAIDRRLARKVVEAGRMTLWQAQQLLLGARPMGFQFGKYIIEGIIGQGGMGRVYLARDSRLGRRVALKVLSRERMNSPRAVARFQREARVGAQLQHENLVRIYDEGEAQGHHYLVMEFIEGKPVGRLLAERGPLPSALAARIGRQIALGLEHAHLKGLIHRDVNPMNILIDSEGTAKLTDLGLAIDLGDQEDIVTRDGATVGTFDYISPEQARHSRSVDTRSDIYSLGCTLYHMIAGRVPFPHPSLPEKLYAHQALHPDPLTESAEGVPEGLDAVIRRMMSKSAEDRYPSPKVAATALEPFQCEVVPLTRIESGTEAIMMPSPSNSGLNGAPPPPAGSDPELPPTSPATAGRSGLEYMPKIDFGPEPSLSETRSGVRRPRKAKPEGPAWRPPRWAVATVLGLAGIVIASATVWAVLRGRGSTTFPPVTRRTGVESRGAPGSGARSAIAVRWLEDDTEKVMDDLPSAIRRAVNQPAEVVLRNPEALRLVATTPIIVSGGTVAIRAEGASRPTWIVELPEGGPLIRVLSDGGLRLSGLAIVCEATGTQAGGRTLIECGGALTLRNCAFEATGMDRDIAVAAADGRKTTVSGCAFWGFDAPIHVGTFPGSEVRLDQCLFVRDKPGDLRAGWPVSLAIQATRATAADARKKGGTTKGARLLSIERCTVVGAGLLAMAGFTPREPLTVEVRETLAQTESLLMWSGSSPFPKGLSWTGQNNHLAVSGPSWVVAGPAGTQTPPGAPATLEMWSQVTTPQPGTVADPVRFDTEARGPLEARRPADFVPADSSARVGADPSRIGPEAVPAEP